MSTINASPAFLDSDGIAKGFMAWQHTFFFFQKLMLFVVMYSGLSTCFSNKTKKKRLSEHMEWLNWENLRNHT